MKSSGVKILVGLGVGCGLLVAVGAVLLLFLILRSDRRLADVTIQVTAPTTVRLNEEFKIIITIENTADEPNILKDIDVQSDYLDGIFIISSDPPFYDTFPGRVSGYQNYKFDYSIAGGETLEVRLYALGTNSGSYSGVVDVCIKSVGCCLGRPIRTVVSE